MCTVSKDLLDLFSESCDNKRIQVTQSVIDIKQLLSEIEGATSADYFAAELATGRVICRQSTNLYGGPVGAPGTLVRH
jgi:hypothetical protein